IVARYTFMAGNDQADLWIDPVSLGNNASIPGATLTTGTASSSDASSLSYIFLNQAVVQTLWVDEVRVGTSWADVTPTTGVVPVPGPPIITQAFMDPAGFVMRGTNGSPNSTYEVDTSTDVTKSPSNWLPIATYQFNSLGNFDCTNPVSLADGQRFYRLH